MLRPNLTELAVEANPVLAARYGVNERTVQRWRAAEWAKIGIEQSSRPVFQGALEIDSNNGCVIYPDLHIPFHDTELLRLALQFQAEWDIEVAIIAGDFLDEETFSSFIPDPGSVFHEELEIGSSVLRAISDVSRRVYMFKGNHEARLERLTKRELGMPELARLLNAPSNVVVSPYHYCYYNSDIIVGHPDEYSRVRGSVPQKLAGIYHKHILAGHSHHWSISEDAGGQFVVVDMPCMADPTRLAYKMKVLSTAPSFSQGFTIIKRGKDGNDYINNFHKRWTDFDAELRKYNGMS